MVGLLPNTLLVSTVLVLLRANSFGGRSQWSRVLPSDVAGGVVGGLALLVAVVLLTVLLQPFQIRVVRVVEGYWEGWSITARLAPLFTELQYRKVKRLRDLDNQLQAHTEELEDRGRLVGTLVERSRNSRDYARKLSDSRRIQRKLQRYPSHDPDESRPHESLLPTALGNALRTTELTAGERYGLHTLASFPRLYSVLPDQFRQMYDAVRNSVDAAVNLSLGFFLIAVITTVALLDEPATYWIPASALALCVFAYVGAIASASSHDLHVRTAYDLYRFDLLKAAHLELPKTTDEEAQTFEELSGFYATEMPQELTTESRPDWTYVHHEKDEDTPKPT
ncbi:hypothetical protein Lesp02_09500 [Lentzea sp. NBRC 105346]|nr:hypothetical protein Lesp02_09500 [Lentzea sp. NBRC 105346]